MSDPQCYPANDWRRSPIRFAALVVVSIQFGHSSLAADSTAVDAPVDFQNEVIAALSKGGCNTGRCHGNANGRGGFRLSLRGQRPQADHWAISRGAESRRVNRAVPKQSLLLLKATAQVPHEGGLRFREDSPQYAAIHQWITNGMPYDDVPHRKLQRIRVTPENAVLEAEVERLQLQVTAVFDDGSSSDVTRAAIYEPVEPYVSLSPDGQVYRKEFGQATIIVRYLQQQVAVPVSFLRPTADFRFVAPEPINAIDTAVFDQLRRMRINPSRETTDVEFLRRVSVDLTGQLPTGNAARDFVADASADKRNQLIDRLLASPRFADHWSRKWADLLRVEEKTMDAKGVEVFYDWIRSAVERDVPQDVFVREILASYGSTYTQPPTNFYRALRKPELRAEAVAQVFMGTRLQCARCHDHPFERWSQDDYHDFAALFAPIQYKIIENKRRDKFDKNQFIGEQIVWLDTQQRLTNPDTGQVAQGRFLGQAARSTEPTIDGLGAFATWLTDTDHPLFARALANRIWSEMTGRGVVDPVDDFRVTNPPSNTMLLTTLTNELIANEFRLRPFLRWIAQSQVYQLSSERNQSNHDDHRNFSCAPITRLPAEVLLDAIDQVTEVSSEFEGYERGIRAGQLAGVNKTYRRAAPAGGLRFLQMFGKPPRIMTCACERSNETTLGQVFELTSGELLNQKLANSSNCLETLLRDAESDKDVIEELFWRTLSRPATKDERTNIENFVQNATNRRKAFEDVLWALINSKEFLMRN